MAFGRDRRAVCRHVVAQPALVEACGRPPVSCLVRDITEQGALIEVTDGSYLPKSFSLRLVHGNARIECQIAHVTSGRYGVVFKGTESSDPAVIRAIRSMALALKP